MKSALQLQPNRTAKQLVKLLIVTAVLVILTEQTQQKHLTPKVEFPLPSRWFQNQIENLFGTSRMNTLRPLFMKMQVFSTGLGVGFLGIDPAQPMYCFFDGFDVVKAHWYSWYINVFKDSSIGIYQDVVDSQMPLDRKCNLINSGLTTMLISVYIDEIARFTKQHQEWYVVTPLYAFFSNNLISSYSLVSDNFNFSFMEHKDWQNIGFFIGKFTHIFMQAFQLYYLSQIGGLVPS
eukprot:403341325